jgi:hypothetical protein
MIWVHSLAMIRNSRWRVVPLFAIGLVGISILDLTRLSDGLRAANQWDILLETFDDPFKVAVLLPTVYLTMIADAVTRDFDGWGYMIWSRGLSRAKWWWSKLGSLVVTTFLYTGIIWLTAVLVSLPFVRWEWTWSQLVFSYRGGFPAHQLHVPPPVILIKIWGLITLDLFVVGVGIVLLAFILRHAGVAWIVGAAVCIISYGVMWISPPQHWIWAPTLHLVLVTHRDVYSHAPDYYTSAFSMIGGLLLVAVMGILGQWITLKREL